MPVKDQDNGYAINVADVTKVYRLYEKPIDRLKESMSISHKNYHRDFYALNQLSFQVKKGHHRCSDPHHRPGGSEWKDIGPAGAGRRL